MDVTIGEACKSKSAVEILLLDGVATNAMAHVDDQPVANGDIDDAGLVGRLNVSQKEIGPHVLIILRLRNRRCADHAHHRSTHPHQS